MAESDQNLVSDLAPRPALSAASRATRRPSGSGAGLPCLSSNICNGDTAGVYTEGASFASDRLSTQHRKAASALAWNVKHLAEGWGLARVGFLTLTFSDHVVDMAEASRRFHSLKTGVLNDRYPAWLGVVERQKSGRIHFHLLVVLGADIRTGFDFEGVARGDYSSANSYIRAEWAFWRSTARRYRFGRTELMPIRSTEEGIGRYVGKYIAKHVGARLEEDKGARLVRYSKGARMATTRFAWTTEGAKAWRGKLRTFAAIIAQRHGCPPTMRGLAAALGPRWAYNWREFILSLPETWPGQPSAVRAPRRAKEKPRRDPVQEKPEVQGRICEVGLPASSRRCCEQLAAGDGCAPQGRTAAAAGCSGIDSEYSASILDLPD